MVFLNFQSHSWAMACYRLFQFHVGGTQARLLIICAVVVSELPFLGCVIEWNF